MQMVIETLVLNSGDPCYSTLGHVDKRLFIASVNGQYEEEFSEEDARHTFQTAIQPGKARERPKEYEGEPYFWFCKETDDGAMPVTVVHP